MKKKTGDEDSKLVLERPGVLLSKTVGLETANIKVRYLLESLCIEPQFVALEQNPNDSDELKNSSATVETPTRENNPKEVKQQFTHHQITEVEVKSWCEDHGIAYVEQNMIKSSIHAEHLSLLSWNRTVMLTNRFIESALRKLEGDLVLLKSLATQWENNHQAISENHFQSLLKNFRKRLEIDIDEFKSHLMRTLSNDLIEVTRSYEEEVEKKFSSKVGGVYRGDMPAFIEVQQELQPNDSRTKSNDVMSDLSKVSNSEGKSIWHAVKAKNANKKETLIAKAKKFFTLLNDNVLTPESLLIEQTVNASRNSIVSAQSDANGCKVRVKSILIDKHLDLFGSGPKQIPETTRSIPKDCSFANFDVNHLSLYWGITKTALAMPGRAVAAICLLFAPFILFGFDNPIKDLFKGIGAGTNLDVLITIQTLSVCMSVVFCTLLLANLWASWASSGSKSHQQSCKGNDSARCNENGSAKNGIGLMIEFLQKEPVRLLMIIFWFAAALSFVGSTGVLFDPLHKRKELSVYSVYRAKYVDDLLGAKDLDVLKNDPILSTINKQYLTSIQMLIDKASKPIPNETLYPLMVLSKSSQNQRENPFWVDPNFRHVVWDWLIIRLINNPPDTGNRRCDLATWQKDYDSDGWWNDGFFKEAIPPMEKSHFNELAATLDYVSSKNTAIYTEQIYWGYALPVFALFVAIFLLVILKASRKGINFTLLFLLIAALGVTEVLLLVRTNIDSTQYKSDIVSWAKPGDRGELQDVNFKPISVLNGMTFRLFETWSRDGNDNKGTVLPCMVLVACIIFFFYIARANHQSLRCLRLIEASQVAKQLLVSEAHKQLATNYKENEVAISQTLQTWVAIQFRSIEFSLQHSWELSCKEHARDHDVSIVSVHGQLAGVLGSGVGSGWASP